MVHPGNTRRSVGVVRVLGDQYLYSFAPSTAVWTDEFSFLEFSGSYQISDHIIDGLFCIWVFGKMVSKPTIQTTGFWMIRPFTFCLPLYYKISSRASNVFLQIFRIKIIIAVWQIDNCHYSSLLLRFNRFCLRQPPPLSYLARR
jgi:hypothetical protein